MNARAGLDGRGCDRSCRLSQRFVKVQDTPRGESSARHSRMQSEEKKTHMDGMCNGLDSVLERCSEAIELQRVFAASLRAVLERSWNGLGAILDRSGTGLGPLEKACKKYEK